MGLRFACVSTLLVALSTLVPGGSAHAADPQDDATTLAIDPAATSSAPGGVVVFHATGGSGSGYAWSMEDNPSGGWVEANGTYHAGLFPLVQDRVRVTDGAGHSATATIDVTYWEPLVVTPTGATLPPGGSRQVDAAGGIAPYSFSFISNASVGSVSNNGLYQAGRKGAVLDVVRVTDAVGQTASVTFSITAGITVTPAMGKVVPRGEIEFAATGGSGTAYAWSIVENLSGGSIDATTGAYHAGAGTHCVDVVRAEDSLGNTADVSVSVGGGVAIAPPKPTTFPLGTIAFEGFGGTSTFTWSLVSPSGGAIDPNTGVYRAGPTGSVRDEVTAVDALGNKRTATVDVGPAIALTPATSSVDTGAKIAMSVSGGSGSYVTFSFEKNESGATITPELLYQAGPKAGRDIVVIVDSVGSRARATVDVHERAPASPAEPVLPASQKLLSLGGGGNGGGCAVSRSGAASTMTMPGTDGTSTRIGALFAGLAVAIVRRRTRR